MLPAVVANDGVSLGHAWLPDGRDEARYGVSAAAAAACSN